MTVPVPVFAALTFFAVVGFACLTGSALYYARRRATIHHLMDRERHRRHLQAAVTRVSARHQNGDPT